MEIGEALADKGCDFGRAAAEKCQDIGEDGAEKGRHICSKFVEEGFLGLARTAGGASMKVGRAGRVAFLG